MKTVDQKLWTSFKKAVFLVFFPFFHSPHVEVLKPAERKTSRVKKSILRYKCGKLAIAHECGVGRTSRRRVRSPAQVKK